MYMQLHASQRGSSANQTVRLQDGDLAAGPFRSVASVSPFRNTVVERANDNPPYILTHFPSSVSTSRNLQSGRCKPNSSDRLLTSSGLRHLDLLTKHLPIVCSYLLRLSDHLTS